MRKPTHFTPEERREKTQQYVALLNEGKTKAEAASAVGVNKFTIHTWVDRYSSPTVTVHNRPQTKTSTETPQAIKNEVARLMVFVGTPDDVIKAVREFNR